MFIVLLLSIATFMIESDSWPSTAWKLQSPLSSEPSKALCLASDPNLTTNHYCHHLRFHRRNHFRTLHICKIQKSNIPFLWKRSELNLGLQCMKRMAYQCTISPIIVGVCVFYESIHFSTLDNTSHTDSVEGSNWCSGPSILKVHPNNANTIN